MTKLESMLNHLKLSKKWLYFNILNIEEVNAYYIESLNNYSIVDHAPLYFLSKYLSNKIFSSITEFANFINFCICALESEDFRELCSWILESNSLNIDMLNYLEKEGIVEKYKLKKLFIRANLLDKLSYTISDSILNLIIQSQDSVVQENLLEKYSTDVTVLSLLSEKGTNKKIRNMAKNQLNRLIYSDNSNRN